MSRAHLKLPILGRLALAVGHLPIPFNSRKAGDFSVDKEKMKKTMDDVDTHIGAGGHLLIWPEGDLNKEWRTLKQFRAGGMEIAIRHDMEVWGWLMVGPADCWPAVVCLGGWPSKVTLKAVCIHKSAKQAAEKLASSSSARLH
eukprot:gnl/TRDRNA2_/TRDRNA2_94638_c1_seq2.p1 gnl/TRDRNA2_/TRDRNA2_94638_c1~~gnl/TRDRNA2_/TRDRNA2_94638_c1_seq2.p1  ORF type:complete len:160 (-),score=22.45 gnl/TRDRNA2_/TRDRNA2_94638_c1_seq2:7-435(-)